MRTNTQGLVQKCATVATHLCGEARVHSYHLMSSVLSFGFKDGEECAPTGVTDGFRKQMVLDHVEDTQVLNHNVMIAFRVLFGGLEMEITALTSNLEMGLCRIPSSLAAPVTALLATGKCALFASERLL